MLMKSKSTTSEIRMDTVLDFLQYVEQDTFDLFKGKKVGIRFACKEQFVSAAVVVLMASGIVCPLYDEQLNNHDYAVLYTDDPTVTDSDKIIIVQKQVKAEGPVISDLKLRGSFLVFDGLQDSIIECEKLQNLYEFHEQTLKTDFSNCLFLYQTDQDFYTFFWLLPLMNGKALTLCNVSKQKELSDYHTIIMPYRSAETAAGINNKVLITYGDEKIDFTNLRENLKANGNNWFNYYGFPHVFWLSAVREVILNGKPEYGHQIKPIKGVSLTVVSDQGGFLPENVEGRICQGDQGVKTFFNGVITTDCQMISTGYSGKRFYKNGAYLALSQVENALLELEEIKDFYVKADSIYLASDKEIVPEKIDLLLKRRLPEAFFPFEYIEVPYIPRDNNGYADEGVLNGLNNLSYTRLQKIGASILPDNSEFYVRPLFMNAEGSLLFDEPKDVKKVDPGIQKEARIISQPIDYDILKYQSLNELIAARKNSLQKIIYIEESGRTGQMYGELYQRALEIAGGLVKSGVSKGSQVVMQLSYNKDYLEVYWACMLAGALPVPLAPAEEYESDHVNVKKLINICNLLERPYIISDPQLISPILQMADKNQLNLCGVFCIEQLCGQTFAFEPAEWDFEEPCLLLFTSGSTGLPKGVTLNQKNIFARLLGEIDMFQYEDQMVDLNWMTLTHAGGLVWSHIRGLYLDVLQVQVNTEVILKDPLKWLELMDEFQASTTWAPNFAYALVANELDDNKDYGWDLRKLKYCFSGGEANISKHLRKFLKKLAKYNLASNAVIPVFGMTETSSAMIFHNKFSLESSADSDSFVPIGFPIAGHEFRITNGSGLLKNEGEIGFLEGKGDTVTRGYYKNDSANEDNFTSDGYFKTGDLGYIKDHQIVLTGREKDVIIVNGLNYYVQDLEAVVDEMEGVNPTYSVATSAKNENGDEEIIIFFTPENEEEIDNPAAMKYMVKNIKHLVREKCEIYPTYVIPIPASMAKRTDLGKKLRIKYKEAYLNGDFDTIINKISGARRNNEKYLLEEYWQKSALCGFLEVPKKRLAIVTKNRNCITELLNDKLLAAELSVFPETEIEKAVEWESIIDFAAIEKTEETDTEFMIRFYNHLQRYAEYDGALKIMIPTIYGLVLENQSQLQIRGSLMRGIVASFNLEYPEKICRLIDFDRLDLKQLVSEAGNECRDEVTAYRNNQRMSPYFKSTSGNRKAKKQLQNGFLAILLGGMGGVGRHLAEFLVKEYGAKVLILGRRSLGAEKLKAFEKLSQLSEAVYYQQVDFTSDQNLETVVSDFEKKLNQQADLFINLAGKVSGGNGNKTHWENQAEHKIVTETPGSIHEVIESKIKSTLILEAAVKKRKGSFLILSGSVNGIFGGSSLGIYSSVNGFQDSYSKYLNQNGVAAMCINWSTWEGIGLGAEIPAQMLKASLTGGFESKTVKENLDYFKYCLTFEVSNPLIGIDRNHKKFQCLIHDKYKKILQIYHTGPEDFKIDQSSDSSDKIQLIPVDTLIRDPENDNIVKLDELVKFGGYTKIAEDKGNLSPEMTKMIDIWKEVLKVPRVAPDDDFFELGGTSLLISKLLFRISKDFQQEITFQDMLDDSSVNGIVNKIKNNNPDYKNFEIWKKRCYEDSDLNFTAENVLACVSEDREEKNILLTGATGFLGVYLLKSLLKEKNHHIYLLVRAENHEDAIHRIKNNIINYGLNEIYDAERITVVNGDLAYNKLGLEDEQYRKLAKEIDIIYHCAANVNFIYNYDALYNTNVKGTEEIIKLAVSERLKEVNFISSYAVYSAMAYEEGRIVTEQDQLEIEVDGLNPYSQSKWVSDKMVTNAMKAGVPCKIYRIGTATGDSFSGRCQVKDLFWLLIRASIKMGKYPVINNFIFHLVPVDLMADAIVELEKLPYQEMANIYNIVFGDITMNDAAGWLQRLQPDLQIVPYGEWHMDLVAYANKHQDEMLLSMLAIFPEEQEFMGFREITVDSSFTESSLKGLNFKAEKVDFNNFTANYKYLQEIGFLS